MNRARYCRNGVILAAVLTAITVAGCAGPALDRVAVPPPAASVEASVAASSSLTSGTIASQPPLEVPTTPEPSVGAEPAQVPPVTEVPAASPEPMAAATTAAAGAAAVLPASRPVRLQIPAIGVDSSLLDLGLQDDGTMQVPPDAAEAGWYTGAPTPGELGPAIIVAHVDWAGELGVFYYLRDLQPGDEISVTRDDGSVALFRATSIQQFEKSQFPTDAVYGNIDHAGLRLITCGGEFDSQARSYLDNIIAFADLVPS